MAATSVSPGHRDRSVGGELTGSASQFCTQLGRRGLDAPPHGGDVGVGEVAVGRLQAQSVGERARAVGHPIPAVHVEQREVDEQVARTLRIALSTRSAATSSGTTKARSRSLDGYRLVGFHCVGFGSRSSTWSRSISRIATRSDTSNGRSTAGWTSPTPPSGSLPGLQRRRPRRVHARPGARLIDPRPDAERRRQFPPDLHRRRRLGARPARPPTPRTRPAVRRRSAGRRDRSRTA